MPWLPGLAKPDFCDWLNALFRDRWRLPSEGKGHTFESCRVRQFFFILQRDIRAESKTAALPHSSE